MTLPLYTRVINRSPINCSPHVITLNHCGIAGKWMPSVLPTKGLLTIYGCTRRGEELFIPLLLLLSNACWKMNQFSTSIRQTSMMIGSCEDLGEVYKMEHEDPPYITTPSRSPCNCTLTSTVPAFHLVFILLANQSIDVFTGGMGSSLKISFSSAFLCFTLWFLRFSCNFEVFFHHSSIRGHMIGTQVVLKISPLVVFKYQFFDVNLSHLSFPFSHFPSSLHMSSSSSPHLSPIHPNGHQNGYQNLYPISGSSPSTTSQQGNSFFSYGHGHPLGVRPMLSSPSNFKSALQLGRETEHLPPVTQPGTATLASFGNQELPAQPPIDTSLPTDPFTIDHIVADYENLCFFGKVWGERVPYPAIKAKLLSEWREVKGDIEIVDMGNEWYRIKFPTKAERDTAWEGQPYFIQGQNFHLKRWEPFFNAYKTPITHVYQWVRVPRLPLEYWDIDLLRFLLREVGLVIKIDDITAYRLRGRFARACVLVDIRKPLKSMIMVMWRGTNYAFPLVYENLHTLCGLCGSRDHDMDVCPSAISPTPTSAVFEPVEDSIFDLARTETNPEVGSGVDGEGGWITASPQRRARRPFRGGRGPGHLRPGRGGSTVAGTARVTPPVILSNPLDENAAENNSPVSQVSPENLEVFDVDNHMSPLQLHFPKSLLPDHIVCEETNPATENERDGLQAFSEESSHASSTSSAKSIEENEEDFMDFENQPANSSESGKKRRLEDRDIGSATGEDQFGVDTSSP